MFAVIPDVVIAVLCMCTDGFVCWGWDWFRWLEMMKTVTKNSVEVAMSSQLRGFMDEFGSSDADILFLEGEIHSDTKPVSVELFIVPGTCFSSRIFVRVRCASRILRNGPNLPLWFLQVLDVRNFSS